MVSRVLSQKGRMCTDDFFEVIPWERYERFLMVCLRDEERDVPLVSITLYFMYFIHGHVIVVSLALNDERLRIHEIGPIVRDAPVSPTGLSMGHAVKEA
jgi:hypothetical protein